MRMASLLIENEHISECHHQLITVARSINDAVYLPELHIHGEAPHYLTPGAVFEFVWNCLVSLGNGLYNLASNLWQAGISKVCDLWNDVTTFVDKFAAALDAVKVWAIDFIKETVETILSPLINTVKNAMNDFHTKIKSAVEHIKQDIQNLGDASKEALNQLKDALLGDMFLMLVVLSVGVHAAMYAITGITLGWGFLISIGISIILSLVVQNLIGMSAGEYNSQTPSDSTHGVMTGWLNALFLGAGKDSNAIDTLIGFFDSIWPVLELIPAMILYEATRGAKEIWGLAVSILGIILTFYTMGDKDARIATIGLFLSAVGVIAAFSPGVETLSVGMLMLDRLTAASGLFFGVVNLAATVV
jgi:hypothetical protein